MTELVFETADAQTLHQGAERQAITKVRPADMGDPTLTCNCYRVAPGAKVSLHYHETKSEIWYIVSGTGIMTLGDQTLTVNAGMAILTPPNTPHGLVNTGSEPVVFVDVAHPPVQKDPVTGRNIGTIELEAEG